jgi:hypothetical protein
MKLAESICESASHYAALLNVAHLGRTLEQRQGFRGGPVGDDTRGGFIQQVARDGVGEHSHGCAPSVSLGERFLWLIE